MDECLWPEDSTEQKSGPPTFYSLSMGFKQKKGKPRRKEAATKHLLHRISKTTASPRDANNLATGLTLKLCVQNSLTQSRTLNMS
jgi:hypothetical protein